nr:reverse transcriptase domain-containing protein [Tanacetum cinerariifolium]
GPSKGYSYPVCTTCGRRHPGECRRAVGTCFKCGQAGHLQKNCKKNATASTSGQADKKPGVSGRVFAITEDHATKTSGRGVVIDTNRPLNRVVTGVTVRISTVTNLTGEIISALQARTLLYHGCEGFLATIHDMTSEIPMIHDQPIVLEFPDVFPDELPGIPLDREVEFNIELIPGAEPISKAPYRMAPQTNFDLRTAGEHKKLQLNELSELRNQAYENSLIYKDRTKKLHDDKIKNRIFNVGDQVLLFNSRLKIFSRKLKSHWSGPFTIFKIYPYGNAKLIHPDGCNFKVNCHRLKHYHGGDLPPLEIPDVTTFPKDN